MSQTRRTALLTADEERKLVAHRDRWLRIGRSTAPARRRRAELAISSLYAELGHPPPEYVWVPSPWAAATWLLDQLGDQLWDQVGGQLAGQLGGQLCDQFCDQLGDQLKDQLRVQLGGQLRDRLRNQLGGQLWGQIRDHLWGQLGGQLADWLGPQLWGELASQFGGQHNAAIVAWLRFGSRLGVQYDHPQILAAHSAIVRSAGWWWPRREVCVISERHTSLDLDDAGRLHAEDGPAVVYPDGWGVYAWHGVRVPPDVIYRPEHLRAEIALAERNAEVRRVMIERMGPERFLRESGAEEIHRDDYGILWRRPLHDDEPLVMVEVTCPSTGRAYYLRVPPEMQRAKEAVAWTFGQPEGEYDPSYQS